MLNRTEIKDQIKEQFPDFYNEEGESFTDFISLYYQWMESNQYTGASKQIPTILDIDTTTDAFLTYFKKEYMDGLPTSITGNQKYLQKHILDLYRSKGTFEGLRLLFRLLYNKEIDIYIPGIDLFTTSSGKWVKRKYIQVTLSDLSPTLEGKMIIGEYSGATAVVESYERIIYKENKNNIIYLSNISGEFQIGEKVNELGGAYVESAPKILGSASGLNIISSSPNFSVGEEVYSSTDSNLKFIVNNTNNLNLLGVMSVVLESGGTGYRTGYTNLTYAKSNVAHPGNDASFSLGSISNTASIVLTNELINTYASVVLNAADYGMPGAGNDDINSVMGDALDANTYYYGSIENILVINPGVAYEYSMDIAANDPVMASLELSDGVGGFLGNNAVISTVPSFGVDRALELSTLDSLFNYTDNIDLILYGSDDKVITGTLITSAVGEAAGYYNNTNGFLSNTKYLIDSNYYQEYSYDIRVNTLFSKYFNILKKTMHPTGKKVFGNALIRNTMDLSITTTANVSINT